MRIRFSWTHDGESWPHVLGERPAAFGEAALGPQGLTGLLETALGLGSPPVPRAERLAGWLPALRAHDGFWSRSFADDELGVARTLLGWRDELALHGWRPHVAPGRLSDLAAVDGAVAHGLPDRLRAVAERLGSGPAPQGTPIDRLELVEPEDGLPAMWRPVLDRLRTAGTDVVPMPWPAGAVPREEPRPVPASFQLVRPFGPDEAADRVAAWLAAQPDWRGTVLIAPDTTLDAALARHGLPTTGAPGHGPGPDWHALSLALHLGFGPPDPAQVQEFLLLRPNPLPSALTSRLLRALSESPGVHSPAWQRATAEGLDALERQATDGPTRRRRAAEALDALFAIDPDHDGAPDDALSPVSIERRLDVLESWQAHGLHPDSPHAATLAAGRAHVRLLRAVLAAAGTTRWTRQHLGRWLAELSAGSRPRPAHPERAGLAALASPAALCGPVHRVVWWDFVRRASDRVRPLPLTRAEHGKLAAAGIPLPSGRQLADRQAEGWQRPLRLAGEVLFVAPERARDGQEQHPHPLWDEVAGGGSTAAEDTPTLGTATPTAPRPELPLPGAARAWTLPRGTIGHRREESASSLARMVGCSLRWALHHHVRVRSGRIEELPSGNRLKGELAHAVLAETLAEPTADGDALALRALAVCRRLVRTTAAALHQPGMQLERHALEDVVQRAARALGAHLVARGIVPLHREEAFTVTNAGTFGNLGGRVDLVLGPPPTVVDFKWAGGSGPRRLRESLEQGTAHQLATYARLLRPEGGPWPHVAFFALSTAELLTTARGVFEGADEVDGPPPEETWDALSAAATRAWLALSSGRLEAPGIDDEGRARDLSKDADALVDGCLEIGPPCRFCDYGSLCGHQLEGATR